MSCVLIENLDHYFKEGFDKKWDDDNYHSRKFSMAPGMPLLVKAFDEALDSVLRKYRQHLKMIKPALEQLLGE